MTPINENDKFKALMSKFLSRASDEVEALENLYEKTDAKYKELAAYYAEDPAKFPPEEFFKCDRGRVALFCCSVRLMCVPQSHSPLHHRCARRL